MTPPARVSVVIPCFNLGEFVSAAADSALTQTYADVELVIVDDGSTDPATRRVVDDLAGPRTRVIRTDNRGLSAARNTGVREAQGSILCCLDADDLLEPGWIERGIARFDAEPDLAFVSHWMHAFGDETWTWTPGRCDLPMLLEVNTLNSAALIRRSVFDAVGGFDETMRDGCEDWEFWIRVTAAGFRGAIVPEFHYRYRRRPDSMSRVMNASDTRFALYDAIMARHPDTFREHMVDVLLGREAMFASLVTHLDALDQEASTVLEPAIAQRAAALDEASRRADRLRTGSNYQKGLEARIGDLESSLSWRITAPLRALFGRWSEVRRRWHR